MSESPLAHFDFTLLDDLEFKEDAVREEIIAPLLMSLGWSASRPARIVRSRTLSHPFVSIGSTKRRLAMIPDYLMELEGTPAWLLDAKSPAEKIDDPDHLSQIYSYAIHREVRVELYTVCNGRELAVYRVSDATSAPTFTANLSRLDRDLQGLLALVSPAAIEDARKTARGEGPAKDFGLLLMKMGLQRMEALVFPGVAVMQIGHRDDGGYSLMGNVNIEGTQYAASFDFGSAELEMLLGALATRGQERLSTQLREALRHSPSIARVSGGPSIEITARLSGELVEVSRELFAPLTVHKFS